MLCGGLLLRDQEEALAILRTAAGALLDLAEVAAPILAKERLDSNRIGFTDDVGGGITLTPIDRIRE